MSTIIHINNLNTIQSALKRGSAASGTRYPMRSVRAVGGPNGPREGAQRRLTWGLAVRMLAGMPWNALSGLAGFARLRARDAGTADAVTARPGEA